MQVFHFFLSLHHPRVHVENISIFYILLFNLVAKKPFLSRKISEQHFHPSS